MSTNEKSIYTIIKDYFNKQKISKDVQNKKLLEIAEFIPFNTKTLSPSNWQKQLKDLTIFSEDLKNYSHLQNRRDAVRAAVWNGIPFELFDVEEKYIYPPDNFNYIDKKFKGIFGIEGSPQLRAEYEVISKEFLIDDCEEFIILDYLGRGDRNNPTSGLVNYFELQSKLYELIHDKLIDKSIKNIYKRYLSPHVKNESENKIDILDEILWTCSSELFEHICMCLSNEKIGDEKSEFRFSSHPIFTFQLVIKKYNENNISVYEEHYRLINGDAYPSHINIKSSQDLIYCNEFLSLVNGLDTTTFTEKIVFDGKADIDSRDELDISVRFPILIKKKIANKIKSSLLKSVTNKKIKAFNKHFEKCKDNIQIGIIK